jgi:hypothetical protein
MAAVGTPQPEIALALDIDPKTLRRHFKAELRVSRIKAVAKLKQGLFHAATGWMKVSESGAVSGQPNRENLAAAIFLAKTLGGMSEKLDVDARHKHQHQHSGEVAVKADATAAMLESARLLDNLSSRMAGGAPAAAGLAGERAAEPAPA